MISILVVDDEEGIREYLADALEDEGRTIVQAADGVEALGHLARQSFGVMITDLRMPGALDGIDLLRKARAESPEMEVIVLTAHGSVDSAVEAMKLGAFDYLQKPVGSPAELRILVGRALERRRLLALKDQSHREREAIPPLTLGDPVMLPVVKNIEKVAPTNATVLLLGESGTGKEVAAQTIHQLSTRRDAAFVPVNCAAISETLMESEIFGHEAGAFTGATGSRRGRLELADGGTLFLDEIGEMKLELQAKLLRVLQEQRFERVGGTKTIQVDVRWIAASNRDLEAMVEKGSFREDLYHRLAVFPVTLPPLRERKEIYSPWPKASSFVFVESWGARPSASTTRWGLFSDERLGPETSGSWPTFWSGPLSSLRGSDSGRKTFQYHWVAKGRGRAVPPPAQWQKSRKQQSERLWRPRWGTEKSRRSSGNR